MQSTAKRRNRLIGMVSAANLVDETGLVLEIVTMDIEQLLRDLSSSDAYPHSVERIQTAQTHISLVLLTGRWAYKIKKPVNFGFVDFTDLRKRKHFCEEEVRLNRRLAPSVYLGVVPVRLEGNRATFAGKGEIIDYAVKMIQLPDDAMLSHYLHVGEIEEGLIERLAQRLATFHKEAGRQDPSHFGSFEMISHNMCENFEQTESHVGLTVSPTVFHQVRNLTERGLEAFRDLIRVRAESRTCETHGDLRLEHIYFFPDREPPDDLVIIDCIEFNERFRYSDPIADLAFLVMDLRFQGYRKEAEILLQHYIQSARDASSLPLLSLYVAYRAVVRAKVETLKSLEREVSEPRKEIAKQRARAYWLLALHELTEAGSRPCLLFTTGLPGAGKSTLAQGLAREANFEIIRADVVRKQLVENWSGQNFQRLPDCYYTLEWNQRTYRECYRQAGELLFCGKRALIDANFRQNDQRKEVFDLAQLWGIPCVMLECRADASIVKNRLENRSGDVSDADWSTFQMLCEQWEEPLKQWVSQHLVIDTDKPESEVLACTLQMLKTRDLWSTVTGD